MATGGINITGATTGHGVAASSGTLASQAVLIRDDVWSKEIQQLLQEELFAQGLIKLITDFPDGDEIHIPKFSDLAASTYTENGAVAFTAPVNSEFKLTISEYIQANVAISDKLKEDSFYVSEMMSGFPAECVRALMEQFETDVWELHLSQTASNANTLNGQPHRYIATGSGEVVTIKDIAQAKLSLDKANVSKNGRVAIIDPSVSYQLVQIDNVIRQDVYGPNSSLKEGFGGTNYIGKYLGFDFYESNMLDDAGVYTGGTGTGSFYANMFMGEEALIGAVRTMPSIEYFRNATYKRDEYSALMRYGLGLYRAESLVTILTA